MDTTVLGVDLGGRPQLFLSLGGGLDLNGDARPDDWPMNLKRCWFEIGPAQNQEPRPAGLLIPASETYLDNTAFRVHFTPGQHKVGLDTPF